MDKKTVKDIEVKGKKVLVRVDFNVPRDKGKITDDTRIKAALPTINYLHEQGAKVILVTHLGRPKGNVMDEFRLDEVANRLGELIGKKVIKTPETVGEETKNVIDNMEDGDVILLENVRFNPGETKNDSEFTKELASLAEIYVNDAFGTAHRAHSSTTGVAEYLPAVAGFLLEKELRELSRAIDNPPKPYVAIIGGAKISDKIGVIENLVNKVDALIIGGGMANTFLKAKNYKIGKSLLEESKVQLATELIQKAKEKGVKLLTPIDAVVANSIEDRSEILNVSIDSIPSDKMVLDIGQDTIDLYTKSLEGAKLVFWNGPMGVFEVEEFSKGTKAIAQKVASLDAISIIGGGDSVAAVKQAGLDGNITHISTGGGASLEFLEGKELPGVKILNDK
ncbi:phosphoglycerate kinase [Desulfonispora thiosulfatigenes DSM 11270]|uniref:Phosphoglycerate kinase n=1 Tax=Desulfonispora thiosulfatigenes DSM 11270 TaxID=656914 RepID=A0A1W1UWI3_DESTI|nr:phosphoglycerate kinase [Desulfonispora thiosulfatigenes]SMB85410.1 phosphoglycerate kinase [Desulfonispora thiosulfatigenes DSM 11270]